MPDEEQNTAYTPKSNESFYGTYNIPSHTPDLDHQLHLLNKETWNRNVLEFWRKRQLNYPDLARIARYILCCPATSVSSERLFSCASDQIWGKRNNLEAETFEKIVFIDANI